MYDLQTGMSIELCDITEQTFAECRESGLYGIDPGLSKRFTTDTFAELLAAVQKQAEKYGVKIECIHLPYGSGWDISEAFEPQRTAAVKGHIEVMRICREVCSPKYFVLHPSTEPIADRNRAEHFAHASESLAELSAFTDNLLVENLPRSCLANTADELLRLVAPFKNVNVCCDLNHFLQETPQSALLKLREKVLHLHVSDNDGVNEKHFLPGDGVIDWTEVIETLCRIGYTGVFNYEVRKYPPAEIAANKRMLFEKLLPPRSLFVTQHSSIKG